MAGIYKWSSRNLILTDQEIIISVLNWKDFYSGSESDEEEIKITHGEDLTIEYKDLEFFQKQNYISELKIMTVQKLQK